MRLILLISLLLFGCKTQQTSSFDPLQYVDPFIGTGGHGHTVPGASVPFGMVQLSPDTHLMGWDASSGYHYDDKQIYGFSHTHLSGTGIGDMGDILFLPFTGGIHDSLQASFQKSSETARPGYYSVELENFDILAELTATSRTGIHKYTSNSSKGLQLMIDLGHILQANWGHKSLDAGFEVIDDHQVRGMRLSSGWAYDHPVYFHAVFSKPFTITTAFGVDEEGQVIKGKDMKVFLSFGEEKEIMVKVGISGVSEYGAFANLEKETPHWDFDQYRNEAADQWRKELNILKIKSKDETVLKNFYTSLYHCMFAPMIFQDVDGKYRGMDKQIHQAEAGYTNYTVFSLWDTFRAWHPLMTVINPNRAAMLAQALVQKYADGGVMPKWPLAANYTGTMIGYPAASVIADVMVKNAGPVNGAKALEGLVYSAGYHPGVIAKMPEPRAKQLMPKHLDFIESKGFIPADSVGGSVSYGLECAYYDWCIAQIARLQGNKELEEQYLTRSVYYKQYFDPETGFMRGKLANGDWKRPFSPYYSDHEMGDYIEGNAWQWSWFVPHDVPGFIKLMGGKEAFAEKLDSLFTANSQVEGERASADISGLIGQYAHGNEPSHHIAYLYHLVDQPHKAQERLDEILWNLYKPTPDGISGNEDCGAMSAWYVLNAMGFYQVCPGDPTWYVGRPLVDEVNIDVGNGKTFRIVVDNNHRDHKYVKELSLNGEVRTDFRFSHEELMRGGEMLIEMSPKTQ